MFTVLHLVRDPDAMSRLTQAVRKLRTVSGATEALAASDWNELTSLLTDCALCPVVIDPYWNGALNLPAISAVVTGAMPGGVIAYGDFRGRPVGVDVRRLNETGVGVIVTRGVDDAPTQLATVIDAALGLHEVLDVVAIVAQHLSPSQQLILRWAIRRGREPLTVSDLASQLGMSPRTASR